MESDPIVNDMLPVATDRVSAAIEGIDRVSTASDGASAASTGASRSSCWDNIAAPTVGLLEKEHVMRGGALHGPVLLSGGETT